MALEEITRIREKDCFTQIGYLAFVCGSVLTILGMTLDNFSSVYNLWDFDHEHIKRLDAFVAVRALIAIGFGLIMCTFLWLILLIAGIKIPCVSTIVRFFGAFPAMGSLLLIIGLIVYHSADEIPRPRDCAAGCVCMWTGAGLIFLCAALFQKGDGVETYV